MAECMCSKKSGLGSEIPPRLSLSAKKYYCHLCQLHTPVTVEDLKCTVCESQFVEEVTPETDSFRGFIKEPSTQPSDSRHHAAFGESSEGPSNLHSNRGFREDSTELIGLADMRRYIDDLEPRSVCSHRRPAQDSPTAPPSSNNAREFGEQSEVQLERPPDLERRLQEVDEVYRNLEFSDDTIEEEDDSDESDDLDVEAAFPSLQNNLPDLLWRTIRRTAVDFEQRSSPSLTFRQDLLQMVSGSLPVGEIASGPPEGRNSLPLIAETSDNTYPRGFDDLLHLGSNLGDYAFGGEWDTIITHILNEGEVSGTPPLDSKQIQAMPKVAIQEADVLNSLQCTICLDNFHLAEMVKNLPCTHLFHDGCIVPWLQLHDTCPICRKKIIIKKQ